MDGSATYLQSAQAAQGNASDFFKNTVAAHATTAAVIMAVLLVLVIVLMYYVFHYKGLCKASLTMPSPGGYNGVFAPGSLSSGISTGNAAFYGGINDQAMLGGNVTPTQYSMFDRQQNPHSADYQPYPERQSQKDLMTGGPTPNASCAARWDPDALTEAAAQVQMENYDHSHDKDAARFQEGVDNAAFTGGVGMSDEALTMYLQGGSGM